MTVDFELHVKDRPGALAEIGEALGRSGVNIDGVCGFPCKGKGVIHLLVEDADTARKVIRETRAKIAEESEVLVVGAEDRPGELGEITRRIADAGANINLVYLSMKGQLVVGAEDLDKVREGLEEYRELM